MGVCEIRGVEMTRGESGTLPGRVFLDDGSNTSVTLQNIW